MNDFTFQISSEFQPYGDQIQAIESIVRTFQTEHKRQTLLGVTGSGKTFTMANVIAQMGLPTLVLAHNKILAAQLYEEFSSLFPNNAVEYFVSYYDYYQPEAYVPSSDTYIDKDSAINDAIDRMRHSATRSLLERKDVIIVASVSCIYGIGSVESYSEAVLSLEINQSIDRNAVIRQLIDMQFERNDIDFHRGTFRVRGDVLEIFPAHEQEHAIRVEFFGDTLDTITVVDPLRGKNIHPLKKVSIYPSSHYAASQETRQRAMQSIREELQERLTYLRTHQKLVEAQRLEMRTMHDLEMLEQMGYCNGIENYSRHFTGAQPGEPPPTLVHYFPKDFLVFVDESHQTIPQIAAMYKGDRSRKQTLVDYGFRLPSALDNRPLQFSEFDQALSRVVYVSATPAEYELKESQGAIVEQIIRPTGLLDPIVEIRPATGQIDNLLAEIKIIVAKKQRVLVTTLTKRMAEDLTEYFTEQGIQIRYMHADIDAIERVHLLRELRLGSYDVLVGINLLREGLDLPEVSTVAILDADKEGFLRSTRSLIQTIGRVARHAEGRAILYADQITQSIEQARSETQRRRTIQEEYNQKHGIIPQTVIRQIKTPDALLKENKNEAKHKNIDIENLSKQDIQKRMKKLKSQMLECAKNLDFEEAAALRDQIKALELLQLKNG